MNGRVTTLLHPYNVNYSTFSETTPSDSTRASDIGSLISIALQHTKASSSISDRWRRHFGEESCPICSSRELGTVESMGHTELRYAMASKAYDSDFSPALGKIVPLLQPERNDSQRAMGPSLDLIRECVVAFTRSCDPVDPVGDESLIINIDTVISVEILQFFDFHLLRHILLENEKELFQSLKATQSLNVNGGKSRSLFFETLDGRFIIKSLLPSELKQWERNHHAFLWYYMSGKLGSYPSILVPFLGVFVIRRSNVSETRAFVIMRNMANIIHGSLTFDLKGMGPQRSRRARADSKIDTRSPSCTRGPSDVLWDDDLRSFCGHETFAMDEIMLDCLATSISNDTIFLSALDIVDYSMILSFNVDDSSPHLGRISVGIVDYLRVFSWEKRIESAVKSFNANISSVRDRITWKRDCQNQDTRKPYNLELEMTPTIIRPELYAKRFRNNILSLFMSDK